ncbi:MAG: type IX secretion system membrane protein PorP/SprF [Sphingobacteriaceae bacterium]|nr:type IX secretion system membrane protein PorP/SprF [Sphingobacteriaceae bacterium]
MKPVFFFFFFGLFSLIASAQQKPVFTQYIFNNYLINPAISGIENYVDFKAGHRNQWTGLEGAPVTNYFSIHAPFGNGFLSGDATSFGGQDDNPMSRSFTRNYMAAEPHHGLGIYGLSDKTGPINRLDLNATYAYHLGLSNKLNLAVGVAVGVSQTSLNAEKVTLAEKTDPAVAASQNEKIRPDLSLGVWVYGPTYFFGLSAQQLVRQTIFASDGLNSSSQTVPHFYFTTGFKIIAAESIGIIPSLMVRKVSQSPTTVDVNIKTAFRDKLWIGASYRSKDAFCALAGFNISQLLNVGYSYDFTTSNLGDVSTGTHEIVLGILLNNRYRVTCPQRSW